MSKVIAREVAVTGALAGTLNDFSTAISRASDYARLFTQHMPNGAPGIDRFCRAMERADESLKQFCHELFKPGGPIDIADAAAWTLVSSECPAESIGASTWYRLCPDELPMAQTDIANAASYLEWRGRLMRHPNDDNLVAAIPGTEVTHG